MRFRKLAVVISTLMLVSLAVLVYLAPAMSSLPDQTITVRSNADLTSLVADRHWNGTGTPSDPYVLENLTIDAAGNPYCIFIANTTLHFIIQNSHFSGASSAAIELDNVANGQVVNGTISGGGAGVKLFRCMASFVGNNTIDGAGIGIHLQSSSNNKVSNNSCSNTGYGIELASSSVNDVTNNLCSDSTISGIALSSSGQNNVVNNDCNNTVQGLRLWSSSNNLVVENRLTNSTDCALYIASSTSNHVEKNLLANSSVGAAFVSTMYNTLTDNTVQDNDQGLDLSFSSNYNAVSLNHILRNGLGVGLASSNGNNLSYNEMMDNGGSGILISGGSDGNELFRNNVSGSNYAVMGNIATGTVIAANNISDCGYAIHFTNVTGSVISENHMLGCSIVLAGSFETFTTQTISYDNTVNGQPVLYRSNADLDNHTALLGRGEVILGNVSNYQVSGQVISGSSVGFCVGYSHNVVLDHNDISDCDYALLVQNSADVELSDNSISDCITGMEIVSSDDSTISNNTFGPNQNDIRLTGSDNNLIYNNTATSSLTAIALQGGSDVNQVLRNNITEIECGISVDNSAGNLVQNNSVRAPIGIRLQYSSNNVVDHNNVTDAQTAILSYFSSGSVITYNLCNQSDYGIVLNGSVGEAVLNSTCTDNLYGIYLLESSECVIENNTCLRSAYGILMDSSSENRLMANNCSNDQNGIFLSSSNRNSVLESILSNNYLGVLLLSSDYNVLSNNNCTNNYDGISLDTSDHNLILNNTCKDNYNGIYLLTSDENELTNNSCVTDYYGIYLLSSAGNILNNNTCNSNSIYGLGIEGSDHNTLAGNGLSANLVYGLGLVDSDDNTVVHNAFSSNIGYAVYIESGAGNSLYNNTFAGNNHAGTTYNQNRAQAYSPSSSNTWASADGFGNYWADWTLPDLNHDGIVDSPYVLAGHETDPRPLAVPVLSAPSTPLGVHLSPADSSVNISWSIPFTNGGAVITDYYVFRGTASGQESFLATVSGQMYYVDEDVTNGQSYYYRVAAVNWVGVGDLSAEVNATPVTVPGPLVDPIPTISNYLINLTWIPPLDDGGSNITGYVIYRAVNGGPFEVLDTVGAVTYYEDSAVVNGQTYAYMVAAMNSEGPGPNSTITTVRMVFNHAPITIDGNDELQQAAATEGWAGSGTAEDPYLILGLVINANGQGTCLYISNTTLHFTVRDCELSGASSAGLKLFNVINGAVDSCSISGCGNGVVLVASFGIVMNNVTVVDSAVDGLYLDHSGQNHIISSTFAGNDVGIHMWSSSNNELLLVNCTDNSGNGMYLSSSSYNVLDRVNCSGNGQSGIYLTSSRWNSMTGSVLSNNTAGAWLDYSSDDNTVGSTAILDNSYVGINITYSNSNIIQGNTFSGEPYAIYLLDSQSETVSANIMTGCSIMLQGNLATFTSQQITSDNKVNNRPVIYHKNVNLGTNEVDASAGEVILGGVTGGVVDGIDFADLSVAICIGYSSGVTVNDCTVSNAKMAMYLQNTTSCIVKWSQVENSAVGLYLIGDQGNQVGNNTVSWTGQGIMVLNSTASLIADNTCSNCTQGIALDGSDRNSVLRNQLFNDAVGIQLSSSDLNDISYNRFIQCATGALLVNTRTNTVMGNEARECAEGISLVDNDGVRVTDNKLVDNGAGIRVQGGQGSTVSENNCSGNSVGIEVSGSTGVQVVENNCTGNGDGIRFIGSTACDVIGNDCNGNTGNGIAVLQDSRDIVLNDNNCYEDQIGILLQNTENCTAVDNTCIDDHIGIQVTGSNLANVTGNTCTDDYMGIQVSGSVSAKITGNTCDRCDIGINVDGSRESEVSGNECSNDQEDGIRLYQSTGNLVRDNVCADNYAGIYLLGSTGNEITNNSCYTNDKYGIGLDSSDGNRAMGNNCSVNLNYGIGLNLANGNTFINNTLFQNEGPGLYIESGSGNRISNNAFLSNNKAGSEYAMEHSQGYDAGSGNLWNTQELINNYGNYWSDLTYPDGNNDSVVDRTYGISGPTHASDSLPLISPYLTYPGAPSITVAVSEDGRAVIYWTASGSLGGAKITNYTIYRSIGQGPFVLIATVGNVLNYTDTGLDNGQPYSYKVSAINLMGEGALSDPKEVTPAREPDAPTDLTVNLNGTASVDLSWTAPYNGGANITEYRIYRGSDNTTMVLLGTVTGTLNYTDSTTWYGLKYFYRVAAVNVMGEGNRSVDVNITMPTVPPFAPGNLTAEGLDDQIDLAWEAPSVDGGSNITGYVIYRGTAPSNLVQYATLGNVTAFADLDVVHGTIYYYAVAAINANGPGTSSTSASNVSLTVPGAPTIQSALIQNNYIVLTWTVPESDGGAPITWYAIYRSTSPGTEEFLTNVTADTLTWIDTTFTTGVPQFYRISAINDQGTGPMSNEVTAKNTKTLVGTVTDSNGRPIAGATVTIDSRTYTTDDNGQYVAEVIPGQKTITISAAGYEGITVEKDVTIRTYDLGTIQLTPLNAGGVLGDFLVPLLVIVAAVSVVVLLVVFRTIRRNRDRKARGKR